MNPTQVYAIVMASGFLGVVVVYLLPWLLRCVRHISSLAVKHLVHHNVLNRHRFLGPWSRFSILLHFVYIAGNAACLGVGASQVDSSASVLLHVGLQAGSLALVNLIPLYAGPQLDFLADILSVSRRTIQQMHRSIAAMVMMLTTFHTVVILATKQSFPLVRVQNLSAVLVGDRFSASLADS
jgi:hypothetical protein